MTRTTDTRQLRLAVDGILAAHGIDNLELTLKLCDAFRRMADSPTPHHTREQILKSLSVSTAKHEQLTAIRNEIEQRVRIRPTGQEWEDFVKWAWQQNKDKGESITTFIGWWLGDEWRLAHPPMSPSRWYTLWPQAFGPTGYNPQELSVE